MARSRMQLLGGSLTRSEVSRESVGEGEVERKEFLFITKRFEMTHAVLG